MLRTKTLVLFFTALLFTTAVYAQLPATTLRILNINRPAPNILEWTVYLKNVSAETVQFNGGQYHFDFNKAILNGGTGTLSFTSALPTGLQPKNPAVYTTSTPGQFRFAANTPPGAGAGLYMLPGDSVRIMTARCSTSVASLASDSCNLTWRTPGMANPYTKIGAYIGTVNTDITASCTFFNPVSTNPSVTITWQSVMKVFDSGTNTTDLTFGQSPDATDGLDPLLGESALPAPPATGTWDARFILPVTPAAASLKDYRKDTLRNVTYLMNFQPGGLGYPIKFKWNPATLPAAGFFYLRSSGTGTVNINMRTDSMYTLSDNLVTALKIVYTKDLCKDVAVTTGWNMVSVPVAATNMTTAALFPTATSPIFLYNNGYSSVTTAENSKGYWARFDQAQVLQMCGTAVGTIQVPVVAGWNMIGGYDKDVTVTAITTTPAGIMTSNFFGFQWLVGYSNPTTLQVGKGYWIRVSQAGTINLNPVLAKNQPSGFDNTIKSDWVKLTVKDNTGNQSILYFTKDKEIGAGYDLPPVPPAGTFDVRFAGDRNLANISTPQDIAIQSAQTALTFKAEGGDLQISDKVGGKLLNLTLHNGKEVTANLGSINMISVKSAEIPTEFALSQNHPNPFNPTTTIRYSLPSNTLVSLKVFDVLGNQVAVLVNELQEAGVYNYQFSIDQYHLSSGVYLYQLKAGNFESIKKMVVLK